MRLGVPALVAVVALAACSSGTAGTASDKAATTTYLIAVNATYPPLLFAVADGQRICAQQLPIASAEGQKALFPACAGAQNTIVGTAQALIDRLAKATPPDSLKSAHDALVNFAKTEHDLGGKGAKAATDKDAKALAAVTKDESTAEAKLCAAIKAINALEPKGSAVPGPGCL